jgi:hypothetical protein
MSARLFDVSADGIEVAVAVEPTLFAVVVATSAVALSTVVIEVYVTVDVVSEVVVVVSGLGSANCATDVGHRPNNG